VNAANLSQPTPPLFLPEAETVPIESNPESWVDQDGDYLLNYALARVRNRTRAEDLVQETFLAALRSQRHFEGRSSIRTWLVGILRNKILDYYRTAQRERSFTDLEFFAGEESEPFVSDGLKQGSWIHELGPADWSSEAGESLDHEQFWKVLHDCTDKLPVNIARIFTLREVDDMPSCDICELMNITENNLWVMLHRARMALRRCLEANWFQR
jgi:RNA polymerase sigma-70 factor (TIGR02943 family)